MKLPTENKRIKSAWVVFGINVILFTLGMFKQVGLTDLGVGLAAANMPVLVYILGESFRPSKLKKENE